MAQRQPPRFRGLKNYVDPDGDYEFYYASDWHLFELAENLKGVMVSPEAQDPQTWISVWKVVLPEPVREEDFPLLREGLQQGLLQLSGYQLESESEEVVGSSIKLERILTFEQDGVTRKRKLWVLYVATVQISICFQGETPQAYDYWLAMANYTFHTFQIPDRLWLAAGGGVIGERDLIGLRKDRKAILQNMAEGQPSGGTTWLEPTAAHRLPVTVEAGSHARFDHPVEVDLHFASLFGSGQGEGLRPVRLVEVDAHGGVVNQDVRFQWDLNSTSGGRLVFLLDGETPAGRSRRYQVYFGKIGRVPTTTRGTPAVSVNDNVLHEQQDSFRINTPDATFYYHKEGAGFASLEDHDGNDWIGYHPGGRSAGEFRGIPNLVEPEGFFHPGSPGSQSRLTSRGPLKVSIYSENDSGQWACTWDIFPHYARLTVLKIGHPYWFLYEGTPGGQLDTEQGYMVRSPGVRTSLSESWAEAIPHPQWVYFGSTAHGRVLYLLNLQEDAATDSYWPMNSEMTVFGFGRDRMNIYMEKVPAQFVVGLVESSDPDVIHRQIENAFYELVVRVEDLETRN